jgi:hypothetical protein
VIPNNRLPMLVYRGALDLSGVRDPAARIETLFEENGWAHGMWRDGIFPYVHYHSQIHEVLGIAQGQARPLWRRRRRSSRRQRWRHCGAAGRDRPSAPLALARSARCRRLSARGDIRPSPRFGGRASARPRDDPQGATSQNRPCVRYARPARAAVVLIPLVLLRRSGASPPSWDETADGHLARVLG